MAAQKRDVLQDVRDMEPEAVSTPSPPEWLRRRNREGIGAIASSSTQTAGMTIGPRASPRDLLA